MSRRVRHTAGTAEEAHSAGTRAGSVDVSANSWNAAFQAFTEDDRARILELALPAGVVYAQQLPDAKAVRKSEEHPGGTLAPFLNGQARKLSPTSPAQVEFFDRQLDRRQRDAVARALATPDIFLLRGDSGAGKSRVVLELIRQEMKRGNRILFLSQSSAALDCVLSELSRAGEALAIRCPYPDMDGRLTPEVQSLLLDNRVAALTRRAREAGTRELAASRQQLQDLRQALASWPRLADLQVQRRSLLASRSDVALKQASLDRELQAIFDSPEPGAASDPFVQSLVELNDLSKRQVAEVDQSISQLEQSVSESKVNLEKLGAEYRELEPLLEARRANSVWTGAWWKAIVNPSKTQRASEVADLVASTKGELEQREQALASALAQRQKTIDESAGNRAGILEKERSRRQGALSSNIAALDGQIEELTIRLRQEQDQLPALAGFSLADQVDLESIHRQLQERISRAETAAARSEEWLALLDGHPQALRDVLIEHTLLTCATSGGWEAERELAARLSAKPFDLLILEEAEQFSETECAAYSSLANRWVLVSDDACSNLDNALAGAAGSDRRTGGRISNRSFFARLWQHLHADPQRLPYSWFEEENHLVCRLRAVAPEQRAWIEAERLADHPQIVLHILALPRSRPVVAEVVFPKAFTIQKAKQFILQELQELAVHAPVPSMHWHEDDSDRFVLQLANQNCQHASAVELATGVQEHLNPREAKGTGAQPGVSWQTCCIEFDRGSGWQRSTAEDWVERHLGLRDLGRTIYLHSLHRYSDALVPFARLLLDSRSGAMTGTHSQVELQPTEAFEFIATPEKSRPERRFSPDRPRSAGIELDLSDAKARERIPPGLRAGLPAQGFVNLAEAQAIVRRLEEWNRAGSLPASVFVVALYESQAEIIRRVLKASQAHSAWSSSIEIGVPATFAHREARWVIVSLTRSHAQQAVALGENPKNLLLALTRGREKVVLIGDPGALLRRLHAGGASEAVDALHAIHERSLLNAIVSCSRLLEPRLVASAGSEGHAT